MIQGRFGDRGQLYFEIELVAANGLTFPVEAMLDTGFSEFVAINQQDIESLEWLLIRDDRMITAQREDSFSIYVGKVILDGREFDIPVHADNALQEILIGSEWLKRFTLVANYRGSILTLE